MEKYGNVEDVLNLTPGNEAQFLGLNWKFLLPEEIVAPDILFTPHILCDGKIGLDYIAKAYKACEFKIIISCQRDEEHQKRPRPPGMTFDQYKTVLPQTYRHKGLKGVIGIIFAKKYLDGIYISITCATTRDANKIVPTKLGLLLRTTILNYANRHLGIKNAYNHAANTDLVKYYRKLGWILGNQGCEAEDPISREFKTITVENLDDFLKSYDVGLIKTESGYPMKLCNYNVDSLIEKSIADFMSAKPGIDKLFQKYGSICLPKGYFSEYLSNVFDESDNTYNKQYDIKQSFEEED
jgi:hypothetical protein